MTESLDRDLAALDEIEELLRAYADARLSPTRPVLARMRAQMLREAAASAATAAAQRRLTESSATRPPRWSLPSGRLPRRIVAFGMAATLTLGTSAAVLAAPPGSPFYNARVAIEAALLPSQVDERLASRERRLDQRLAEAAAAAERGDLASLEAALAAYGAEVDAVVAESGTDVARLAHLDSVLARHTAVLQALAERLPAQSAIERAIDASNKAASKLKEKGGPGGGRPSEAPTGPGQGG